MKKILIAAAALTLMCGAAFAAEGDNFNGPASKTDTAGKSNVGMQSGSTQSGSSASKSSGVTTGMDNGKAQNTMKKDDTKTDTSKDGMKK